MREDNLKVGNELATYFNKKLGVITYSGTLAIEIALQLLLNENDNVLVSSEVCYSIINTILKLKMNPIIIKPKNNFYLTDEDIDLSIKKYNIKCIMLVHQYGLLNNINLPKYRKLGIRIIEDVAQAWDINSENYNIGVLSDIVVTSFGKTKPLSYGIGGGLFFDDYKILDKLDFCDNISRENPNLLLSYLYPLCNEINVENLIFSANSIVQEQRKNAEKYDKVFRDNSNIDFFRYSKNIYNIWHRFPIWIKDDNIFKKILFILNELKIEYQLPHDLDLIELKKFKDCDFINNSNDKINIILLRTRNINLEEQNKKLKKMLKLI